MRMTRRWGDRVARSTSRASNTGEFRASTLGGTRQRSLASVAMRSRPRIRATFLALWLSGVVGNPALMLRCPIATAAVGADASEPCSHHAGAPHSQRSHKAACCRCPGLCTSTVLPSVVVHPAVQVAERVQPAGRPGETLEAARLAHDIPFATGPPLQS
jgi:hypothetical protein